jgi:hypothetical protein
MVQLIMAAQPCMAESQIIISGVLLLSHTFNMVARSEVDCLQEAVQTDGRCDLQAPSLGVQSSVNRERRAELFQ